MNLCVCGNIDVYRVCTLQGLKGQMGEVGPPGFQGDTGSAVSLIVKHG